MTFEEWWSKNQQKTKNYLSAKNASRFVWESARQHTVDECVAAITEIVADESVGWPCQNLHGGRPAGIYDNVDGLCKHPECCPTEDDNCYVNFHDAVDAIRAVKE